MKHLVHFTCAAIFLGLTTPGITETGKIIHLPPVSTGGGIWIDRGQQAAEAEMRKKLAAMDEELRETRAAQTALLTELEHTQARLLKTREADDAASAAKIALAKSQKQLQTLRYQLEQLEVTSINKERQFQRQLETATAAHAEAKTEFERINQLLKTRDEELNKNGEQIDQLKAEVKEVEFKRDAEKAQLARLEQELASYTAEGKSLLEIKAENERLLAANQAQTDALSRMRKELDRKTLPREQVQQLIEQNTRLTEENKRLVIKTESLIHAASEEQHAELNQQLQDATAAYKKKTEALLEQLAASRLEERKVEELLNENARLLVENKQLRDASQQAASPEQATTVAPATADNGKLRESQIRQLIEQNERLVAENRNLLMKQNSAPESRDQRIAQLQAQLEAEREQQAATRAAWDKQLQSQGMKNPEIRELIDRNLELTRKNEALLKLGKDKTLIEAELSEARSKQASVEAELAEQMKLRDQRDDEIRTLTEEKALLSSEYEKLLAEKEVEIRSINQRLQTEKKQAAQRDTQLATLQQRLKLELDEVKRLETIVQADSESQAGRTQAMADAESRIAALRERIAATQGEAQANDQAASTSTADLQKMLAEEQAARLALAEESKRVNKILEGNQMLIRAQKNEIGRMRESMSKLTTNLKGEGTTVARLKTELQQAVAEKQALQAELEKQANQIARVPGPTTPDNTEDVQLLQARIAELESSLQHSNRQLADLDLLLKEKETQAKQERKNMDDPESAALEQRLAAAEIQVKKSEQALKAEQLRIQEFERMQQSVDAEIASLRKELANEKKQREELEQLAEKHRALKGEISDLNQFLTKTQLDNQVQLEDMTAISIERDSLKKLISDYEAQINQEKAADGPRTPTTNRGPGVPPPGDDESAPTSTTSGAAESDGLAEQLQRHQAMLKKLQREKSEMALRLREREEELAVKQRAMNSLEQTIAQKLNQSKTAAAGTPGQVRALQDQLAAKEAALAALKEQQAQLQKAAATQAPADALTRERDAIAAERDKLKRATAEQERTIQTLRNVLKTQQDQVTASRPTPPAATPAPPASRSHDPQSPPVDNQLNDRKLVAKEMVSQAARKLREGKIDFAIQDFRRSLVLDGESVRAKLGLATALYNKGEVDEATDLVNAILGKNPKDAQALGLLSILKRQQGKLSDARQLINEAISIAPEDPMLLNYLGIVANSQKKRGEAIASFEKAVQLDPMHAEARFNLAVLLASGNGEQLKQAIKHYEAAQTLGSARDERLEKILYR